MRVRARVIEIAILQGERDAPKKRLVIAAPVLLVHVRNAWMLQQTLWSRETQVQLFCTWYGERRFRQQHRVWCLTSSRESS